MANTFVSHNLSMVLSVALLRSHLLKNGETSISLIKPQKYRKKNKREKNQNSERALRIIKITN